MRHTPVYVLIAVVAIVAVGLGLATAMVVSSHGYFLDPDGRAHVQTLTGLNYGIVTPEPRQVQSRPVHKPTVTPHPTHVQAPCTTTMCIITSVFCNGSTAACLYGQQAQRVAMCMSGEMPGVTNTEGGMGLFGLRASTWAMSPEAMQSPFNASANAKAAYWLFQKSGMSWYRWGICAP